ncbi:hypothetical protein OV208_15850 [Corallococcus sp. bb12-1]|uniref:Uncharacterized protein n=1 Tax=Corallococcus terminator TaxID=2316733 RepID=A0A3A8IGB4_9BACT|nr:MULTISPECIES: hypothetical protein [Corallococcus]MCY1042798.1 hypothetical protein [Corallococcus sp. bb12-1]RKG76543.1 hypothetical protein D7V88_32105 [Corallococcus terminator]
MRSRALLALSLSLLSSPALAQKEFFFGTGEPPVFREADMDKRFLRSRVYQALTNGTSDPGCAQLVGALLTVVGESAPFLHKRDENFFVDPALLQTVNTQLSTPRFPASMFLVSMMRRVLIDKKLPAEWLQTAVALAPYYPPLDVGKLRFAADGVKPVDSFFFTLPAMLERYDVEVLKANTTAASVADAKFRDDYLDKEVGFGGLEFVDAKLEKPKKKKGRNAPPPEPPALVARLVYYLPDPAQDGMLSGLTYGKPKLRPAVTITARLKDAQYMDLATLPKGTRVLLRGRFWEYRKALKELEVRDALLFQDRDWTQNAALADPAAVAACPLAFNDLTGTAPVQPGGFGGKR